MSRNEVFIKEGIQGRTTEEQMNVNDGLAPINESSDNKEITPTDGIRGSITIENDYATVIYEELDNNKVVTPTDTEKQFSRLVWFYHLSHMF